jgi:hypothetical protein
VDAIHLPNAITLPTAFGAAPTAGQVIQALVLDLIESDLFRLQLPQAVIDVRADVPLTVGSTITLAVKSGGANARLAIYAGNVPAQSLSVREPIGEAVVIGRVLPNSAPANASAANSAKASLDAAAIRDAPSLSPARAPAPVPQTATPAAALGAAVRAAAARQNGAAALFADAAQIVQAPAASVPAPVREAAAQIVALRVPLDETLTAADVKQAFASSGVLLEPKIAAARPVSTQPSAPSSPTPDAVSPAADAAAPQPAGDLKAALLVFRQVLKSWADETAPLRAASAPVPQRPAPAATTTAPAQSAAAEPLETPRPALPLAGASIKNLANALLHVVEDVPQASPLSPEQASTLAKSVAAQLAGRDPQEHLPAAPSTNGPPPPYRGAPLSSQPPVATAITPDMPAHESAERLLAETDGAIARTTLLQAASLPDQAVPRSEAPTQRWTFEIPFATPQGTSIAQFEISRDGRAEKSERQLATWRARFSLDVEPMGPVHALVGLAGARTSVTLWAERPSTVTRLTDNAKMLGDALRAAALEPTDVQFRVGVPPVVARQAAPGRFMDRAT